MLQGLRQVSFYKTVELEFNSFSSEESTTVSLSFSLEATKNPEKDKSNSTQLSLKKIKEINLMKPKFYEGD